MTKGKTARRIKKLLQHVHVPAYVNNHGVMLPTRHRMISPGIKREIYFGSYESKEIEIVSRRVTDDDVVMEVGAGIGYLSAFCAQRVGGERVFAYEANPAMMEVIADTHARNGVKPQVFNVLLAEGDGECSFYVADEFWASSAKADAAKGRQITVPQRDLNAELARVKPTFLIVDIEGGEIEFFATARLDGVRKICVETHPGVLTDAQLSQMFAGLFAQGFALDFSLIRKNVFFLHRD